MLAISTRAHLLLVALLVVGLGSTAARAFVPPDPQAHAGDRPNGVAELEAATAAGIAASLQTSPAWR